MATPTQPLTAPTSIPAADAAAPQEPATSLRFADRFELQPGERRLLVDGEPASLGARAFDLLLAFAERPETLLTRSQLFERVWPGLVVEDNNLAVQISTLRKLLGGDVIATIPGHGYRFTARIEAVKATRGGEPVDADAPAASSPSAPPAAAAEENVAPLLQTNLPVTLPPLVGRAEDMAALDQLVGQHRLVSIVGAGGMGKTTVALHLTANRQAAYAHGVCWVELINATEAEALPSAIAAAMGVDIGRGDPLKALCGALAPLTMLLTLDNAEQVVEGVARLAQAVLDKAPGVRFVVTSQAPLKLPAERAYRIGSLTVPQGPLPAAQALEFGAVALFVERAQGADARFSLTDANSPAVIELCRQLDGLALAIELAAARAPMLGVQRLASSMGDRLKVLNSNRNRIAPLRQQTLRAALEWSHSFLEPRERAVFRRLAVFAGSASLSMVQQVVPDGPDAPSQDDVGDPLDEWAVLDALALLVDRSLVVALTSDDRAEPRYRLLESPRFLALEQLRAAGEEAALRRRHRQAIAALFDEAWSALFTGAFGYDAWQPAMTADLDNGREALAAALAADDVVGAVQIATTIFIALPRSAFRDMVALADALEPHIERIADADLLARASRVFALAFLDTRRQQAQGLVRRCVARMPPLSPGGPAALRWAQFLAMTALVTTEGRVGDLKAAQAALVQARALADPAWPPVRGFFLAEAEMWWARLGNDMSAMLRWTRGQLAMARASGRPTGTELCNTIDCELAAGLPEQAAASGMALVASLTGSREERDLVFARLNLSAALLALDDPVRARPELHAGWVQAAQFDLSPYYSDYLALLAALEGRFDAAAKVAAYAEAANAIAGERLSNEAAAHARAMQLARAALGDEAFDRAYAEGAALREADVGALAFGER